MAGNSFGCCAPQISSFNYTHLMSNLLLTQGRLQPARIILGEFLVKEALAFLRAFYEDRSWARPTIRGVTGLLSTNRTTVIASMVHQMAGGSESEARIHISFWERRSDTQIIVSNLKNHFIIIGVTFPSRITSIFATSIKTLSLPRLLNASPSIRTSTSIPTTLSFNPKFFL